MSPVRTYLQMSSPADLRPARVADPAIRVQRIDDCDPALYRRLYVAVGDAYHWVDRLPWTDDDIRAHLAQPELSLHMLFVGDEPAGYFELKREPAGSTELAYFGLLPPFVGRGLGGHLLTAATEQAWSDGATRVWLHTSTLDHPAALPNYLKRGFRVFRVEEYEV